MLFWPIDCPRKRRRSVYNDVKHRKAVNLHTGAAEPRECLAVQLEKITLTINRLRLTFSFSFTEM